MTEPIDPELCECFAASVEALENDPQIEALVASILSDKHPMSAEDLAVFEELVDDPEIDPEQRAEFLQVISHIVVSIIDYQWEMALRVPAEKRCESIENRAEEGPQTQTGVLKCEDSRDASTNHKSAEFEQCQKGSP